MAIIRYAKDDFELEQNQSVLDCLTHRGVAVPFPVAAASVRPV
jgi:hypothetical protein